MAYPPPPPPPRRNTTRIVLIVVGVVAAVCVLCAGAAFAIYRYVTNATQPQRDAVHGFLGDLEDGDVSGAYAALCERTRRAYTQDEFVAFVADQPRVASHAITAFSVDSTNGATTGTVTATLTYVDGSTERHVFDLTLDEDGWHVCGDPY